jgi:hypothetical protein
MPHLHDHACRLGSQVSGDTVVRWQRGNAPGEHDEQGNKKPHHRIPRSQLSGRAVGWNPL